jgi:hypothetical protein
MRSHTINKEHQCEASSGNATRCDSKVWRAHGKTTTVAAFTRKPRRSPLHSSINRPRVRRRRRRARPGNRHEWITSRLARTCSLDNVGGRRRLDRLSIWLQLQELPCGRNRENRVLLHYALHERSGGSDLYERHHRKAAHAYSTLSPVRRTHLRLSEILRDFAEGFPH